MSCARGNPQGFEVGLEDGQGYTVRRCPCLSAVTKRDLSQELQMVL